LKISITIKHKKQTNLKKVLEFLLPSNCGACKSEELQCALITMENHEFVEFSPTMHYPELAQELNSKLVQKPKPDNTNPNTT
jgi:hypothetical protein